MTVRRPALAVGLLVALLAAAPATGARSELAPYQLVRSLQLVQDRIAGGDHAALPMQNKLLEMIDDAMRTSPADAFGDIRNFRALLVYAMSGGNPATVDIVLARLDGDEHAKLLGSGVLEFLRGQRARARSTFHEIDPMAEAPEIGAFLALVKGSVAAERPAEALRLLDQARLLAPGTLVEEAALRRSIPLGVALRDPARFLRSSSNYVRAFLRSPYAGEFAGAFVSGVVELHDIIDMAAVEEVIAEMNAEQREVIYLRLARKGAIERIPVLSAFTSRVPPAGDRGEDPRAVLYSSMATVTSDTIGDVAQQLEKIDMARLSANDQRLLEAARSIVSGVLSQPPPVGDAEPDHADLILPARDGEEQDGLAAVRRELADVDKLLRENAE